MHPHLLSLFTQHLTSRSKSPFLYYRKDNVYVSCSYQDIWGEIFEHVEDKKKTIIPIKVVHEIVDTIDDVQVYGKSRLET